MGIEERDAARELFPPMPLLDTTGGPDVVGTQDTVDVLVDAAATIRGYMLAFPTPKLAARMAHQFDKHLTRLFPGPRRFHFLLEGDVPATKRHERQLRSQARHAGLRLRGIDFAAPALALAGAPPALRRAAEALAGPGRAAADVPLREAVAWLVARGAAAVADAADDGADAALQKELVHQIMPELERICLGRALALAGEATAVAVDDADLPPEGEAKALPYARRLGRPCIFVGNDTDVFIIALLQVPRFADHPPVYYHDIARTRMQKHPYMVDLVGCVRALPAGGAAPADRALALLLCGNDYVPSPDGTRMTLCRLARKRTRTPDTYDAAYQLVAATAGDAGRITDLVATRFDAKAAYERPHVEEYVKRALVATRYYAAASAAEVPPPDVWTAHGWRGAGVANVVANMN